MLNHVVSRLTQDEEMVVSKAIGCLIAVHRELGPGFPETAYARATAIELGDSGLSFEAEKDRSDPLQGTGHLPAPA